jgi:hypothetical protein
MFFNINKLKEGAGKNGFTGLKNTELTEGKNPKTNLESCLHNWRQKKASCHTNRNWEKLRE